MLNKIPTVSMAICISLTSFAQPLKPALYKDYVFAEVTIQKNLSYSTDTTNNKYYLFDLYRPKGDSSKERPLIIWMHGGGFKYGTKKAKGIRMWGKSFARRGYTCAAINYRLSKKNPLRSFKALVKGCSEALEDVTKAIEFFKKNNTLYNIDTTRIILAGNSAGAIIALQSVYSSQAALSELIDEPDSTRENYIYNRNNVVAIINFWGALFNTNWLKNANIPIVSAHGRKDRIIPYAHKDSPMYGSYHIHQTADSLKIPNRLKTFDRFGHELQKHFIPIFRSRATKRRWLEAGQFAADFLYKEVINNH